MSNASLIGAGFFVIFFGLMVWRRTSAMRKPIKGKGAAMIWPLLFFLPGFAMFANPQQPFNGTFWEVAASIVFGAILSVPMVATTNYEVREDGQIYAKQSRAFLFAIVGVVGVRLALKEYITALDPMTLNGLFFFTAITYVVIWRVSSFIKFRRVYRHLHSVH
jgi:membrane protein CcdC involved in cytochrome C biogenesis